MGYLDALISSYFKTGQDGRKLFYPWGVWGRGYVLASEQDDKRVRQHVKAYYIAVLVLLIGAYALQGSLGAFVIGVALFIAYAIFKPYLVRGLEPSSERLSLTESFAAQARAYSAVVLWSLEAFSLALLAISIVMLIFEPSQWVVALGGVILFGFCTAVFAWMLVLRRWATSA